MSVDEYFGWMAFFQLEHEANEQAMKKAKSGKGKQDKYDRINRLKKRP